MDVDTQDVMLSLALQQFHEGTTIYVQEMDEFYLNPQPDSIFLSLWFMDKVLENRMYYRNNQELSGYRQDFHWFLNREQAQREKLKRENQPPFSEERIEKMHWAMDVYLMEMASAYLENT